MKETDRLTIRNYLPADQSKVISLWQECGLLVPWNNPYRDIERKYRNSPEMFFIGDLGSELVATCMAGYDGHRGWIYYLAVKNSCRGMGIASEMVKHAESSLIAINCPKIDLMVRNTNDEVISFYQSIGYEPDPVVVLSKRLIEDEPY